VGKLFGRKGAIKGGVGLAAQDLPSGGRMAALAVVNAFGDIVAEDGSVLAGPRRDGLQVATTSVLRDERIDLEAFIRKQLEQSTTLVCLVTDASLDKSGCAIVSKMANAGMARAVDPVHSAFDGDVVFTLASGSAERVDPLIAGVIGAALTAEAIRDGVRQAVSLAGIPSLADLG
jgi:L-aminopeptidase/D-esterase-like protein